MICAALAGCLPTTDTVADSLSQSRDRVILVGSFEITPKIEQRFSGRSSLFGTAEEFAGDRIITGFIPSGTTVTKTIFSTPFAGATHSVPLDNLYFIEVPRTAIVLKDSQYLLSDAGVDDIRLPGGLFSTSSPTAQVVYIGTVRFARDDFYAITDVRVIDRYAQAAAAVRSRYGANVTIAKALWQTGR